MIYVHTLILCRICLIMYKCKSELVSNVLKLKVVANKSIHAHNTKQRHCIYTFRGNNEFAYRIFTFHSVYF